MALTIHIPTPLRRYTEGAASVQLQGDTIGQLLDKLGSGYPELEKRLFNGSDRELNRFLHVYVNEEDIRFLGNLETPVKENDRISIILAVAGG